jgi:hypothetical protein
MRGGDGPSRSFDGGRRRGDGIGPRDGGGRAFRGDRDGGARAYRGDRGRGDRDGRRGGRHHDRGFIRRHGHRYSWGPGIGFWFYDGYYYGDCDWLRRRAIVTGSRYWWRRYYLCIDW